MNAALFGGDARSYFRLPRRFLALLVVLAIGEAAGLIAFLVLIRVMVDGLAQSQPDTTRLFEIVAALAIVAAAIVACRSVGFWAAENMGFELVRRLRMTMYAHLQGMSPRQLQGRARGGLLLRFTGDLSMLRTWISRGLGRGLVSAIVLIGGVGVIAYLDPRIAIAMLSVLAMGAAVTSGVGPGLWRVTRRVRKQRSLVTGNIDEQLRSLAVVQVFGRSAGERDRLSRQNDSLTRSLFRTSAIRAKLLGMASGTGYLAIVVVLAVGVLEVVSGRATVGVVVTAVIASRQLVGPVRRLGLSYDYWQRARVSAAKVVDFMRSSSRPLEPSDLARLRIRHGEVELRSVSLDGSVRDVSATAAAGHLVAIVGPTGAGKSSLLQLISGLEDPDAGEISIDGRSTSEYTLRSRFRQIGMVSPDLPLMRGSVRRNLTYRDPSASFAEVERVVALCGLDDLIAQLTGGLDAWVFEGAINLSTGQRQRLALGRALMGNPALLLLDEPTTNLDESSRDIFRRVISHHRGTVLLVTHDPVEAALADEVWFMEAGRIETVMSGPEYRDIRLMRERHHVGAN
jgi:ATP-binding cassette, subfamily B, bacterial